MGWSNIRQLTWCRIVDGDDLEDHTFVYGADGIRCQKDNIYYTRDGDRILSEYNGNTGKTITYLYGEKGVVGINYNGADYYYRKNIHNDVLAIYNTDGEIVAEYEYDAWGKVLKADNKTSEKTADINPIRYRSYYYDVETGFYYLNSRYYDPEIGRFLNADTPEYLGDGNELNNYNLFSYCGNNPVMYSDPTGHAISAAIIIGAIVGAVIGFGATVYADYRDDGKVFNGSIGVGGYLANTFVGGVIGGFIGGFGTSTFTFAIPKLAFVKTTIGTTQLVVGTVSVAVSGAEILAGLGLLGLGILCLGKPNSGRIRFSDGTGIDPSTGKEFTDPEEARKYYNTLTDPIEKNKWKSWFKQKGWRRCHLK